MRPITHIVIHCSATREKQVVTIADVRRWHTTPKKNGGRGFKDVGYHCFIRLDGTVERGRPVEVPGAHVENHNLESIGICYAGGLDANDKPKDTRTQAQKAALLKEVVNYRRQFPKAKVVGHRDLSPDTNKNGKVDKWEYVKECPCFEVSAWVSENNI